jgi:mannitol PTS system EIIA component
MKKIFNVTEKNLTDNQILEFCTEILVQNNVVTDKYYDYVIERSKVASLYMGNGLIIPHSTEEGRKEIINEGGIAIVWFKNPVKYENEDIHFSVTIAVNNDSHIDILSSIAEKFIDYDEILELIKTNDENKIKEYMGL